MTDKDAMKYANPAEFQRDFPLNTNIILKITLKDEKLRPVEYITAYSRLHGAPRTKGSGKI
jgi:hypothetical protein